MALGGGQGFWEMAANGLSGQSWPRDKVVFAYGMNEGGRYGAKGAGVYELEQFALRAAGVGAEVVCGCSAGRWGGHGGFWGKWHEPEPGDRVAVSLDDDAVIAQDRAFGALEEDLVSIVAEFADR
jgi:hypothetical protein